MIKDIFLNIFKYSEKEDYSFVLPTVSNNLNEKEFKKDDNTKIFNSLEENRTYLKTKYNMLINSDIKLRDFTITLKSKKIPAFLLYIDGMVDDKSINEFIMQPLLLRNSIKMQELSKTYIDSEKRKILKINLENFLYESLIPQNSVSKEYEFSKVVSKANNGFCILFVENLSVALCIETKGFKGRSVSEPVTEAVVKGSQEAFVENIRTNTSMLRKIINNENLVIEECEVGSISKTKVDICYIGNITNDDLVAEAKFRVNNLKVDYLISSGQLEQLIKDSSTTAFPQTISTERPDRTCNYILKGRVAILVNGSPFSIILPAVFTDFLSSPEDFNLNYHYANFLRALRCLALICALSLPGMYIAITMYHYELIPSELLFAITAAREAIPFPIIFEILIMECSFELIQEASIRVPSSFSTTVGIIGALILGEAAVSANIVSPILIIIVAFTGISAFAIPDNSLRFSIRMFRFIYIILGYVSGFLGIAFGFFVHFLLLSKQNSFGVPFFAPYIPLYDLNNNDTLGVQPVWKREKRNSYLNTKKPNIQEHISMKWRQNGK